MRASCRSSRSSKRRTQRRVVPRCCRAIPFGVAIVALLPSISLAQTQPSPLSILQASYQAMGGFTPADSEALAGVEETRGATSEAGTLRTRTRGTNQSSELRVLSNMWIETVYNDGHAFEKCPVGVYKLSQESAVTTATENFPLVLVAAALTPGKLLEYVGLESVDGVEAHHVRVSDTFSAQPAFAYLAYYSRKDIWIATGSSLVVKVAHEYRRAGGDASAVPIEARFSDYRTVGNALYPFRVDKKRNGTPWLTFLVQTASINLGLVDTDFDAEQGGTP